MAGTAAEMNFRMWRALVASNFFAIPVEECPSCPTRNDRPCGQYFCTECRLGNVCGATFHDGGEHSLHRSIRVWMVTDSYALRIKEVRRYMPRHLADRLQLYMQNERKHAKVLRPGPIDRAGRSCTGPCGNLISPSRVRRVPEQPVCSIQCLLDDLDRQAAQAVPGPVRKPRKPSKESVRRADYEEYVFIPQRQG